MESIFKKDLDNSRMYITRVFKASADKVWEAWTNPKILEEWWAPKPYRAVSVSMDFRNGGTWMYYMLGPEGDKNYCKAEYSNINPITSYEVLDAFCDADGNMTPDFPRMQWKCEFAPVAEGTQINMVIQFASVADMEKIMSLGFQEGFTMAHGNLDEYLEKNSNS